MSDCVVCLIQKQRLFLTVPNRVFADDKMGVFVLQMYTCADHLCPPSLHSLLKRRTNTLDAGEAGAHTHTVNGKV